MLTFRILILSVLLIYNPRSVGGIGQAPGFIRPVEVTAAKLAYSSFDFVGTPLSISYIRKIETISFFFFRRNPTAT